MDNEVESVIKTLGHVLRNAVLRALVAPEVPFGVPEERRTELLQPWGPALESDDHQIRELVRVAYLAGVQSVHAELHGRPGIDSEMLDEAIEHYSTRLGDGEPVKL